MAPAIGLEIWLLTHLSSDFWRLGTVAEPGPVTLAVFLLAAGWLFSSLSLDLGGGVTLDLATLPFVIGAVLLPPPIAGAVAGLAVLASRAKRLPRRPIPQVFTTAMKVTLYCMAGAAVNTVSAWGQRVGLSPDLTLVTAVLPVFVVLNAIETLLVAGGVALATGMGYRLLVSRQVRGAMLSYYGIIPLVLVFTVVLRRPGFGSYLISAAGLGGLVMLRHVSQRALVTEDAERHSAELAQSNTELEGMTIQLAEQARTDPLTGLMNRRAFFDQWNGLVRQAERYGQQSLSVISLDIDHFKSVNDTYGHETGDLVLRRVASILAEEIRDVDVLARIGGEEFSIALPQMNLDGAMAVATRLRDTIRVASMDPYPKPCTISLGVASTDRVEVDELLGCADRALYDAKEQGRDRAVAWET